MQQRIKALIGLAVFGLAVQPGDARAQNAPPSPAEIIDAAEMLDSVEAEMNGDYGEMARDPSIPLGAIQRAWDDAEGDAGIYTAEYRPDQVVRVRVRQFMPTTIVLPEWEEIGDFFWGDTHVFEAEKLGRNMIRVGVNYAGADTVLTVVGKRSRQVYPIYLRAEGVNSQTVPDVVVRIVAGEPAKLRESRQETEETDDLALDPVLAAVEAAARPVSDSAGSDQENGLHDPDYLTDIPVDPSQLRFDFTMSGDRTIAPERVFSDGVFTYFDYGDRWDQTDLPAVYRVVDGVDTPQNVRYRGSMIVVEAAGGFTLRNGQRVVCVRPAGWEPSEGPRRPDSEPAEPTPLADSAFPEEIQGS